MTRFGTNYLGVFYREAERIGENGTERVFYILFKKDGKVFEEKVGRQYADQMTPAKAAKIRENRIEGRVKSRQEMRDEARAEIMTIALIWRKYKEIRTGLKGLVQDENRFKLHINPVLGKKQPSELVPLDVDRIRINMGKKSAPGTVRNVLELLRRLVNFAEKKQLCPVPSWKIRMPVVNIVKTEDLTPEQMSRLIAVLSSDIVTMPDGTRHMIDPDARDAMRLALATGMRRSEIFSLRWEDIDDRRLVINIRNRKSGVDQCIPLPDAAIEIFKQRGRGRSPFIFAARGKGKKGHRLDAARQMRIIREAAGLPKDFRPMHGLRHTFASMLASSGQVDMCVLQRLLTHATPELTQRYAHLRDGALRKASNLAGEIVKQAAKAKEQEEGKATA